MLRISETALLPRLNLDLNLFKPVNCELISGQKNMQLLPGHIGLAEYEVTLGIAQELSGSLITLQNLPGSLHDLLTKTAENITLILFWSI